MNSPRSPGAAPASPLAIGVLGIGIVFLTAALLLGLANLNAAELVRQALKQGKGEVSPETMAWLQEINPVRFLGLLGAAFLVAGLVLSRTRQTWRRWVDPSEPNPSKGPHRSPRIVIAASVALMLGCYYRTLIDGFFRFDDFDMLAIAMREPFWPTLWALHGDHFLPLSRLAFWVLGHGFGTATWPWNFLVIGSMAAVLLTGARVLADLGASRSAQLLFVVLTALWSPWAELLSGYYILTCFVVIVWLSLVAWLAYRRWQRERSAGSLLVFGAAQLIAPAIELSGLYVIAAAAVFVGIELIDTTRVPKLRARIKTQAPALAVIAFAAGLSAAAMAYVYLVLHPGTFLGMASTGGRSLVRITVDLFYAFDVGLLVAMVVPFIYARLPGLLLVAAAVAAFAAWALFLAKAARVADADRRRHLLAALLVSLGICLMVILGRPPEGQIAVRWAAKHVGPAYVWLCVVIALGWDTLWRNSPARARLAEFKLLAAVVFVGAQTAFGLLGMAVSFPPFGYPAEIRDARARRQAVEALRRNIVEKFQTPDLVPLSIPTLDGEFIRRRHPSLFIYNLSHYEPFFAAAQPLPRLLSGPGMQTWRTTAVQTTPRLRDAVSPRFLERLGVDPELRDYYLGEITLVPEKNSGRQTPPTPLPGGAPMIAGNGFAERMVRAAAFDPEETPRLFIWVSRTSKTASSSGSPPIIATIVFNSEISGGDWSGRIELPADPAGPLVIDLRQVYAFSLSRQVSRLRLIVSEADSHRLHLVKLSP